MPSLFVLAIIIFGAAYTLIISEKINRTVTALAGAVLMILLGVINQHHAIEGIDFNTLGLLIGMMIVVDIARHSGMFQYIALSLAQIAKGKPIPIFLLLGLSIAVFSALLDNVTTVMLMVPVTFVIANNLKVSPYPFLIGAILMSNIGGSATLIGDPPNILIGSAANLSFNQFVTNLGPISFVVGCVTLALLAFHYRKQLQTTPEAEQAILRFKPKDAITDYPLLYKSLFVIGLIILAFMTHSITHIEGATIALSGAALLLILTLHEPDNYLKEVEWPTIFFFIGLFVMVTGLEHVGAINMLAAGLIDLTAGNQTALVLVTLWGSAVLSAVVDNIPFVATMIPLIQDIGTMSSLPLEPLWWSLALGADIGGNATIVGASANLLVCGMAEKQGKKISFFHYFKIALPLTIIALMLSTVYLYFRYLI